MPKPRLTRDALVASMAPPNNCRVKLFRDTLDPESREVFDEAVAIDKRLFPAPALSEWLIGQGFDPEVVPNGDAISNHRAHRRPCRCGA